MKLNQNSFKKFGFSFISLWAQFNVSYTERQWAKTTNLLADPGRFIRCPQ